MSFLVDTNILSELVRPRPDPGVLAWASGVQRVSVSVVTVHELAFGLALKSRPRAEAWLEDFLARSCDVLEVTEGIARAAAALRAGLAAGGEVRSLADMLIAATSLGHGLTLVTRNERDFSGCGIQLLNPFQTG